MHLSKISLALRQWGNVDPNAAIKALFASGEQGAWYDPSDLTTMFQDSAGSTPVTADGQPVGKILDKSGRGNHATAPNDSARPLYKTDGTYHWLQFDGVDDTLATAANPLTSATQGTEWHGALRPPGGGDTAVIYGIGNTGGGTETMEPFSGDNGFYSAFLNNERPGFGTLAYNTKYILTELKNTNSLTVRKDGAQSGAVATVTSLLGTQFQMCFSGTTYSTFYVYSLILLGRLATTQEITDTETWVNGKTGAY